VNDKKVADQALAEVTAMFVGRAKPPRAKPHRCIDCKRVTRHVRCPKCTKAKLDARVS
jgi:hypothetical protein